MTRKDYKRLAEIIGHSLSLARSMGEESGRTMFYEVLYEPLVKLLAADNEHFDRERFAFAVADAESYVDPWPDA